MVAKRRWFNASLMRWLYRHPTILTLVAIIVVFSGIAAFWVASRLGVFDASMSSNLKKVEHSTGAPAWWLGRSFAGLPLTRVDAAGGDRVADFGYGSCHSHGSRLDPFTAPRCGYPLWIAVTNRRYTLTSDDVPKLVDGSCARIRVRGAPAAVGTDGIVVYTGDQQVAVLGPPELVGRALAALRPVSGSASFRPATLDVSTLDDCNPARSPFEPLSSRLARLSSRLHLPTVDAGQWFDDGQRINAESTGSTLVLEYSSCGSGTENGDCGEVLSISSEAFDAGAVATDLEGANCEEASVAGAPAVIWDANSRGASAAGVLVFTDHATISLANQLNLYPIDKKGLRRVVRALRPVAPATTLPPPAYDVQKLLRHCAKLT
jgi:hypothetical protein